MLGSRKAAWRSAFGRTRAAVGRLHRCERGQAIYVVALFFFLLAGLLFLIVNSGEKLNHKVEMQSAADSAAATGAAWFARGLNVISMCNVAETQLLSLIVLCDTLETVTPPASECIDDLLSNLGLERRVFKSGSSVLIIVGGHPLILVAWSLSRFLLMAQLPKRTILRPVPLSAFCRPQ